MLSIILAVVIARQYLTVADKYNKTKWLWGTIGVVVFIGSQLLMGVVLGIFMAMNGTEEIPAEFIWNIVGMIAGFGIAYGVLELMKRNAQKETGLKSEGLLDQFEEIE